MNNPLAFDGDGVELFGAVGNRPLVKHAPYLTVVSVDSAKWPREIAKRLNWFQGRGARKIGQDAEARFFTSLRELVDQWLDSSRDGLHARPYDRTIIWSFPLSKEVYQFATSNSTTVIDSTGQISQKLSVPLRQKASLGNQLHEQAIFAFLQLMNSPRRSRLFRCDGCRRYFVQRRDPRKEILRGIFCKKCKKTGRPGKVRMDATNDNRTKELVRLAADYWPRWDPKKHRFTRSKWVAANMQDSLPEWRTSLSGNWVTRHAEEIEAEVERRRYAER